MQQALHFEPHLIAMPLVPVVGHRYAKGVLAGVVPWREARRFFAWRLKRRLTEEGLIRHISSTDVSINRLDAIKMVRGLQRSSGCCLLALSIHVSLPCLFRVGVA